MRVLIENDSLQLVYTQMQDIPFVMQAEAEPENAQFVGKWSQEEHVSSLDNPDVIHLVFKDTAGQNVGYGIICGLENPNDRIELMRLVVTEKGHGYGKTVLSLIKKWCFEVQRAHRLWLDVRVENFRAQHVYEAQGFTREGLIRDYVKRDGGYKSVYIMSILSDEYFGK